MAEYWYVKEGFEQRIETFLKEIPQPEIFLKFDIAERDFVTSGSASSQIKMALKRLGVAGDILRRTAIASYEAEINVTAHSKGGTITGNIFYDCIHLKLEDRGPGIEDIEQSMTPGYSTADDMVREMGFGAGLGLPNIKKNSDMMHITSEKGKTTFLEIVIYYN